MSEKDKSKEVLASKIISHTQLTAMISSLNTLQLEYDIEKRYIDEERASTVGVAQYTIRIYANIDDARQRFEAG